MKTQMIFLVVILCINVTCFVVMTFNTVTGTTLVPGMQYVSPINGTGDLDDYTGRFNSTELMDEWRAEPLEGIPTDVFSGLSQFFDNFRFLIDGVPSLFSWLGSIIPVDATAFEIVAWGIRIITACMFGTLILEFITGRELLP